MTKALLIVDMQNDFMPKGALAVHEADTLVPIINELMKHFEVVIASLDWHPEQHISFATKHKKKPGDSVMVGELEQILWPEHCREHTPGAALVAGLNTERIKYLIYKGTDPFIDSYSAFFDNAHKRSTGLQQILKDEQVSELYVCGVALDYCVRHSAIDAANLNFDVFLIQDACKAVQLKHEDSKRALNDMKKAGVKIISAAQLLA